MAHQVLPQQAGWLDRRAAASHDLASLRITMKDWGSLMAFEVLAESGCDGGDCPTFFIDTETGAVRVRGYDPKDPRHELDVDIPPAAWARLVSQLPR